MKLVLALLLVAAAAARADWFEAPEAAPAPETGAPQPVDQRWWVVLPASGSAERTRIANAGVSIEEVSGSTVGGVADRRALERLRAIGIHPSRQTELEKAHLLAFPQPDAAFHDYSRVKSELAATAAAHPKLVSLLKIGSSLQGRDLVALRFNSDAKGTQKSAKPGVVFLGTHHAREHLSTEVPLLLAKWLAANAERADVKKLLDSRDVYFVPLVNPDGAEYDHAGCRSDAARCSYKWHRKNMRENSDGSRGVDLNRNYGFHWNTGGASDDPGSDTYHGPAPFSEPETQAVKRFVEERPNLKALLSYHTFSELVLYPWGHKYDPIDDGPALAAYKAMATKFGELTGYTPEQSSELYIASGDTTDWAWGERGIFSFTFELTPASSWDGGFYPGAKAIDPTFQKNIAPMLYLLEMADDPYRAGITGGGASK
ncbi:MAG: zinc carboxypeptidase [Elusimicrobia bacterium]|nr:zinc carboxypeptidase [Elusimicrobiota bacterium]